MFTFVIYLALVMIGLCMGSFAGASVWRLRAQQLREDKDDGIKVDVSEYKRLDQLNNLPVSKDHSRCLNCSYYLKWYDLIPLLSWLSLGGKCRKCHKPIGFMEPLIEFFVMLFFILSYLFWPNHLNSIVSITSFIIWLASGVCLAILFVYDLKWYLLPNKISFTVIGLGLAYSLLILYVSSDKIATLLSLAGSVFVLSGIYLILYIISKGKWIGFGDIKLGLGLGFLLADWRLAFIALMAANVIGCLIVIPLMIIGKLKRTSRVPFGPMLIAGFVLAGLFGRTVIDFYNIFLI